MRRILNMSLLLAETVLPLVATVAYFTVHGAFEPLAHWTLYIHAPSGPYTPNPLQVVADSL